MTPEMEEAMKDPEAQKKMAELAQAMNTPEMQEQAAAMQAAVSNPKLQERLKELQDDPEFDQMFADLKEGGMGALMKYWNNPEMLAKLGDKLGDVSPPPEVSAAAASQAAAQQAAAEPDVSDLLGACRAGDLEAVEDFIAIGKDVNMSDAEKRTPLHYAAAHDHAHIVRELLSNGGNLENTDAKGNTPLHYAAGYGRVDIVELFLDAGSDCSAKNETGKTPSEIMRLNPNNPLLAFEDLVKRLEA